MIARYINHLQTQGNERRWIKNSLYHFRSFQDIPLSRGMKDCCQELNAHTPVVARSGNGKKIDTYKSVLPTLEAFKRFH
jgi:hypothetical protein